MMQSLVTNLIKTFSLQKNMHYIFDGPTIFIVALLLPWSSNGYPSIDLHLQFEGAGNLVQKNTFFTHKTLFENSGNFSSSQLVTGSPTAVEQLDDNTNYSLDYTTILLSNFSTKVQLQVTLEKEECSNGDSFLVITDVMQRNATLKDCCKTKCDGRNSLINYEDPFFILITKKFQQSLPFRMMWIADKPYQSSSTWISYHYDPCGEVVGGSKGSISYKRFKRYLENERCIWVIVPQPRSRSAININVTGRGISDMNDHLYMMELTDVYGNELSKAPRITRLLQFNHAYKAYSREVYIVFYSDPYSFHQGFGFTLSRETQGHVIKSESDVTKRFTIYKSVEGSANSVSNTPFFTVGTLYQVFIFTPIVPTSVNYGTQLRLNQTFPIPEENDCFHKEVKVFTSTDGIFTKDKMNCSKPGEALMSVSDGMAVMIITMPSPSLDFALDFEWKQAFGKIKTKTRTESLTIEDNICGGVIIGDEGVLKYKLNQQYWNHELCVWLLHAPNSRSITLTLASNQFELCCDFLIVNTIDFKTGTLNSLPKKISADKPTGTFEDAMLILVFYSDTSTRGGGFTLQFSGKGHIQNPKVQYKLHHLKSDLDGTIEFPSSDWDDGITGKNDIYIIASSLTMKEGDGPSITPVAIDWVDGVFMKKNDSCSYDSLILYEPVSYVDGAWEAKEQFPGVNDASSCPDYVAVPERKNIFSSLHSAFLAIYKPASSASVYETFENETRFRFDYYRKSSGCGGVIVEESGYVSYKEGTAYLNSETCIWLLEVPEAQTISFDLENEGFESCCDFAVIHSVDAFNGLNRSAILTAHNKTAVVDGPVVVVTFVSDGSVTGHGFRIRFMAETRTSLNSPYRYHLISHNKPTQTEFAYEVEANQIVLVAFSPETHHQIYDRSFLRLNVTSFRPQIEESCQSDTLLVYDGVFLRYDESWFDIKPFTAEDVVVDGNFLEQTLHQNCTPFVDNQFQQCDKFLECSDAPVRNSTLTSYYDAFVAVYVSVNSTGNLKYRGFVLVSIPKYDIGVVSHGVLDYAEF